MEKLECDGSWWSFLFLLSAPHGGFSLCEYTLFLIRNACLEGRARVLLDSGDRTENRFSLLSLSQLMERDH